MLQCLLSSYCQVWVVQARSVVQHVLIRPVTLDAYGGKTFAQPTASHCSNVFLDGTLQCIGPALLLQVPH